MFRCGLIPHSFIHGDDCVSFNLTTANATLEFWRPHRGNLEGVVGAAVVQVVAHAGDEEGEDLYVSRERGKLTIRSCSCTRGHRGRAVHVLEVAREPKVLVEQVAEVADGEGVHPVVVRRVPVAFLHHKTEPDRTRTREAGSGAEFYLFLLLSFLRLHRSKVVCPFSCCYLTAELGHARFFTVRL